MRAAAFAYLDDCRARYGSAIPWRVLQSFRCGDDRIALVTQRGIRWMAGRPALSFMTTYRENAADIPYDDHVGDDGLWRYRYQGTNPNAADNVAMKRAAEQRKPLVWFVATGEGVFDATYPMYVVGHNDAELSFVVAEGEQLVILEDPRLDETTRRRYVERITKQRLFQPVFRSRVLRAYSQRCTICRLRHVSLLDAAHIRPDAAGGQPVVTNGLALCKIHHASYDQFLLSVTPDFEVRVHPAILRETDGPMLLHGLQETHERRIVLPRRLTDHPDRNALLQRHQQFLDRAS